MATKVSKKGEKLTFGALTNHRSAAVRGFASGFVVFP